MKKHGVDIIELGVQSLDEEVLKLSNRGHDAACVYSSSKLIKDYGFLLGLMLAYVYEKYGSLKAPAAAHMAMNLLSVLATRYGLYNWMLKDNMRIGVITVVCAMIASTMFVLIQRIEEKPELKTENENLTM